MSLGLSLVLIVFFVAMNAFFVIAEFAFVRVRRSQIEIAVGQGKPGAKNALHAVENVNSYLAVCQLGITIASLVLGWIGEPTFVQILRPLFDLTGAPIEVTAVVSTILGLVLMTSIHVICGEQIPKSLALFNTEAYALWAGTPLRLFYRITYPITVLFTAITNAAVKLMGYDPTQEREAYTDEEIKLLVDESTESGLIEEAQNEYVDNVFDLSDRDASSIMTPRTELVCVDMDLTPEKNMETVRRYKYTRYPVIKGNKDRIIGFIHVKDLFTMPSGSHMDDLPVRTINAVPGAISIPKLLQTMQKQHTKIAVVVDEHGGTEGIVTMSDIMEQIVGRIHDEYQHETEDVLAQGEGSFEVEGTLDIAELEDLIGFPPKNTSDVKTVAGLIMDSLDRIPEVGDSITLEDHNKKATLTVLSMDVHRVDRIVLELEETPEESESEPDGK